MASSEYSFSGKQGKLDLRLTVRDSSGKIIEDNKFEQTDRVDRKYSVTNDRSSRYVSRIYVFLENSNVYVYVLRLPNQRKVSLDESDLQVVRLQTAQNQREKDEEAVNHDNNPELGNEDTISDSQDYLFYDVLSQ